MSSASLTPLCLYGVLKLFVPHSQYVSNILNGPTKNFTVEVTTQEIFPQQVYSNVLFTLLVSLVTDLLRYKPIIVLGALAAYLNAVLLYSGHTLYQMKLMVLFMGVTNSANVAYRTYIYTQVDKSRYQWMTAVVSIMPKAGLLLSSFTAQILFSLHLATFQNLLQISLMSLLMAFLSALLLPPVENSLTTRGVKVPGNVEHSLGWFEGLNITARLLVQEFKAAYTNLYVLKWSIYWIFCEGASQIVFDYYVQALWSDVSGGGLNKYNGGVDVIYTLLSILTCYLIGCVKLDWSQHADLAIAMTTVTKGIILVDSSNSQSLFTFYVLHAASAVISDVMLVVCRSEVASNLENKGFAFIFGINTFLSLILQSTLRYVLTSKKGLALPIRLQFSVVGYYFIILGLAFLIKCSYHIITSMKMASTIEKKTLNV